MNSQIINQITEFLIQNGPGFLLALVVLFVGLWIIKRLKKVINKLFLKRNLDPSLSSFLKSLIVGILKILLGITVLGMIGIEMTSFIAILGAAGLAIGLALSGSLQNFAGGVMILLFKPFKVGDFIEANGFSGTVSEIRIFNTIMKTPDNKTIIIPNGNLSNNALTNFTTESTRRVDFTIGIGYGDSVDDTYTILNKFISEEDRILKEPAPFIGIETLADSSVNFKMKVWVNREDYWPIHYSINERVYREFEGAGLNIPFPQMDVHVHQT